MADVNVYYHQQTNSWWTNSDLDGVSLVKYIEENPIGLGTIETYTGDKPIGNDLNEIHSMFIPNHIKQLNEISTEIEANGLENAEKVSKRQLKKLLK